jgi:hypothetical protein
LASGSDLPSLASLSSARVSATAAATRWAEPTNETSKTGLPSSSPPLLLLLKVRVPKESDRRTHKRANRKANCKTGHANRAKRLYIHVSHSFLVPYRCKRTDWDDLATAFEQSFASSE